MVTQPTQPAGEGMADSLLDDLRKLSVEMPENSAWQKRIRSAAASADRIIAERDALQTRSRNAIDLLTVVERALDCIGADRDRLAARCEGLTLALVSARRALAWGADFHPELAAAYDDANAALSPPASDATEPQAAGVA